MSVQAMSWVFDHSKSTSGERLVMLAIANHYDFNKSPLVVIAREAHLSRSAVIRAIHRLEADGELEVERIPRPGRSMVNAYRIPGYEESRNATLSREEGSRLDGERVASEPGKGLRDATRTISNHREPSGKILENEDGWRPSSDELQSGRARAEDALKVSRAKLGIAPSKDESRVEHGEEFTDALTYDEMYARPSETRP